MKINGVCKKCTMSFEYEGEKMRYTPKVCISCRSKISRENLSHRKTIRGKPYHASKIEEEK